MGDDGWYNSSYTVQYYTSNATSDSTLNTFAITPQQYTPQKEYVMVPEPKFQAQLAVPTFARKNKFHNDDLAWLRRRVDDVVAASGIAA